MSNKHKIVLLSAALGLGVAAVFNLVHAVSGGAWALSVPVGVVAALGARSIHRRWLLRQTNDHELVATDRGPDGRIEAIEVFWRPG